MEIIKANPSHSAVIAELAADIWKTYYPAIISREQIDYMLEKMYSAEALEQQMLSGQDFYVAYDQGTPIGYISYSSRDQHSYFLHKFYIDTRLHRNGAGELIFKKVMCTIPGIREIRLTVNRKNFKAINFYFKLGFKIEEVKDFDIGNGYFMNDFVMLKIFA